MRRSILPALSAVLLACGTTPKTHIGGPCESNHACDDGQICDLTDPAGPVCLDESGDLDGDGIANGKDFCEHLAGGDHDEDGDGMGDECDPCPISKPPAQAESDGDGVDATCDPDPRTSGDKIVLFNGFNAPIPGIPSTWQIQGGEAIMTPATSGAVEQLSLPLALPTNRFAILAAYRVDSVTPGALEAGAGVISVNDLPMGRTSIQCGGSRTSTDQLVLKVDAATSSKPLTNLFNPASLYRVAEQVDGVTTNCVMISDSETGVIPAQSTGAAMNRVGLYARDAKVRFAYILVVGH